VRGQAFDLAVSFGAEFQHADVAWVNSVHRAWLERARHEPGSLAKRLGRYVLLRHQALLLSERRYFGQRSLKRIISVADAVTDDVVRLYGVDRGKAATVHNGFDPAQFSPTRRATLRSDARTSFGFAADDIVLVIVANELRRKGLDTLLDAVATVGDPRLRVLLVGRTPPAGFTSDRLLYAGPSDDVGFAHAAADLFVLPTQYEAFCLAIVEALASGLPVITTAVPGAADVVLDGETGLIQADPRSSTELAGLLRQAMEPGTIARWSAAAPASVRHLAWPIVLTKAQEILERVPGRGPSHH
jgi:glycosyltransferase involved in cell wall biosynthesis